MADRANLREFQTRLSERLREAATGTPRAARLGVEVGGRRFLVDLGEAGEIVALSASIAAVPLTQDWFKGLVNLRGSLFGVSDLARFEGGEFTAITKRTRLLAFAARLGLNAAILVERMLGLQNPDEMTEETNENQPSAAWHGRRWRDGEGHLWTELSLSKLACEERFLSVGR